MTGSVGARHAQDEATVSSRISCNGAHLALAEKAAIESMVLLKNDNRHAADQAVGDEGRGHRRDGSVRDDERRPDQDRRHRQLRHATIRTGDLGSSRVFSRSRPKAIGPFEALPRPGHVNGTTANSPGVTVRAPTRQTTAADGRDDADFIVVMAGLTAQDEGEEYTRAGDRASFGARRQADRSPYQDIQNNLIQQVAALGQADGGGARRGQRHRHAVAGTACPRWSWPGTRARWAARRWASCSGARRTSAASCRSPGEAARPTTTLGTATGRRSSTTTSATAGSTLKSTAPLFPFGYGPQLHDVRVHEAAARLQRHEQGGGAARGRQRREHRHRRG